MKHILTSSLLILASSFLAAFGAANDTLITFSTPGPDKYADGTTVKDGECYALVWTKTGATFAGIAADGVAVGADSQVLVYAPVAKGGRCPTVAFELDADLAATYKKGTFGVYLLDTRLADGRVGGLNDRGVPVAVNGYGQVKGEGEGEGEGEQSKGSSSILNLQPSASTSSIAVTAKSAVPADAPKPQITAIKVVGDKVFLTVKGTLPCLQYAAAEVKVKGEGEGEGESEEGKLKGKVESGEGDSAVTQGAATVDEEITIVTPKKGASGFFQVARP